MIIVNQLELGDDHIPLCQSCERENSVLCQHFLDPSFREGALLSGS